MLKDRILELLDKVDGGMRERIESAENGMRNLESSRYTEARELLQRAISLILRVH